MRYTFLPLAFFVLLFSFSSCTKSEVPVQVTATTSEQSETVEDDQLTVQSFASFPKPETLAEQFSYISGYQMASSLSSSFSSFDMEYMMKGIYDALNNSSFYTTEESNNILQQVQTALQKEAEAIYNEQSSENLAAAESFLSTNAHRSGVVSLSDKIQYEVLKEGSADGKRPNANSTVSVYYQLVLLNGDVKGGTADRSNPSVYNLQSVIEGFREVVLEMKEGEKIRAWIHPSYGYGEYGSGTVGPNQLLIFDIELISVNS